MKHEHDEIFTTLRAEMSLELDDELADYITQEADSAAIEGGESARGRAFAAEIAQTHGLAGIQSLYRCLRNRDGCHPVPHANELLTLIAEQMAHPAAERPTDASFRRQLKGRSDSFTLGARIFCEQSGVV